MKISIFGLGYVGTVSIACLARDGHEVVGVDIDESKLEMIGEGQSPIVESGIQDLIRDVVELGRVRVTGSADEAIQDTDLSFICVGTPSSPNGSQDLTAICRLAEQIGDSLRNKQAQHTIVVRSTVQPGTVDSVIKPILEDRSGKLADKDFFICFQPEFLREGSSIRDFDNPPFTLIGCSSETSLGLLRELFEKTPGEFLSTSIRTAEMLKFACNNFHALKITFANEIGRLAQALAVDPHEVMELLCKDKQLNISHRYLKPGFAFGGSCLPKDLRALVYMAKQSDVDIPMLSGIIPSNIIHIEHAVQTILDANKKNVGMVGLSFKSGTDDLRESPLVEIAERLIGKGYNLKIYDPEVNMSRLMGANRRYIEESIPHIASLMSDSLEDVVVDSEVIVIGLQDSEIIEGLESLTNEDQFILDLVTVPNRMNIKGEYHGVCW